MCAETIKGNDYVPIFIHFTPSHDHVSFYLLNNANTFCYSAWETFRGFLGVVSAQMKAVADSFFCKYFAGLCVYK